MVTEAQVVPVREGDVVADKYRVDRVLGEGGMGVVVAATHLHLDQRVALKFVQPSVAANPHATERFLREARAAVRLKSQHVCRVLDVGTLESGTPYIVMEFLEGSDLGHVLADRGKLPVESAVDYVLQACEAVAEAHALGIVHRDLKPQNLFLTQHIGGAPMIKVLDFGISKLTAAIGSSRHSLTQTSSVMGSPLYMAPEQMRSSRTADPRADIWALGVVLYELLTGGVPFDAESMPELCLKVVEEKARPIEELRADVPPPLRAVIARCLEKDPARRFADAAALATALEPFANVTSRPAADRARRVAVSIAGAGAGGGGLGSASDLATPPPDRRQTPATWGGSVSSPAPSRRALGAALAMLGIVAMITLAVVGIGRVRRATHASGGPAASVTITSAGPAAVPVSLPVEPPALAAPSVLAPQRDVRIDPPEPSVASPSRPTRPARVVTSPVRRTSSPPSPNGGSADDEIPALR